MVVWPIGVLKAASRQGQNFGHMLHGGYGPPFIQFFYRLKPQGQYPVYSFRRLATLNRPDLW